MSHTSPAEASHGSRAIAPRFIVAGVMAAIVAVAGCSGSHKKATTEITGPPAPPRQAKWGLDWADEFNGPTLDAANWIVSDGPVDVNSELEYYSPSAVTIENGALVLRSDKQTTGTRAYTSGEVRTGAKHVIGRGTAVEWRTQVPSGKGIWPANWMVATPCNGLQGCGSNWPPEIDVMEMKGSAPNVNIMTHWWGSYPGQQYQSDTWTSATDLSLGYHTYRVEWYRDSIIWLVDGQQRAKHTSNITNGAMQLVMNTAVGGQFDGNPDGTTTFPQFHRIDYVRVYRDTANVY
ncbi:MAG: family 16 glycosylhydrolase [Gemmatimonadaceae bacterium]